MPQTANIKVRATCDRHSESAAWNLSPHIMLHYLTGVLGAANDEGRRANRLNLALASEDCELVHRVSRKFRTSFMDFSILDDVCTSAPL
jgi:hypothetical protein